MYWALLQIGRRLVVPAEFAYAAPSVMRYEEEVKFHDPQLDIDGSMTVDLIFPATEGTIQRLMTAWWDAKVRQQTGTGCGSLCAACFRQLCTTVQHVHWHVQAHWRAVVLD
jgi:hypothetical protein